MGDKLIALVVVRHIGVILCPLVNIPEKTIVKKFFRDAFDL